jgi:hypothetical protein
MTTATTRAEAGNRELITRRVTLTGINPIMFDRYPGDNQTQLQPGQKFYLAEDGRTLTLPATNIMSFLSAKNTDSAPKRLLDSRKYKKFTEACASFVMIQADVEDFSESLVITRNGDPLEFSGFDEKEKCPTSGAYIQRDVARLEKGIPNPKVRPVISTPWEVSFRLSLFQNDQLQEQQLKNIFEGGGIAVGLGTWRGRFGKFVVSEWE